MRLGRTTLRLPVSRVALELGRELLAQPGIDVNLLNNAGESPLMMAALKGDMNAAQMLLERGAKVNQPGWSALHYASTDRRATIRAPGRAPRRRTVSSCARRSALDRRLSGTPS